MNGTRKKRNCHCSCSRYIIEWRIQITEQLDEYCAISALVCLRVMYCNHHEDETYRCAYLAISVSFFFLLLFIALYSIYGAGVHLCDIFFLFYNFCLTAKSFHLPFHCVYHGERCVCFFFNFLHENYTLFTTAWKVGRLFTWSVLVREEKKTHTLFQLFAQAL